MDSIVSDVLQNNPSGHKIFPNTEIYYYFAPFADQFPGGDRFCVCQNNDRIFFYIADATGHGEYAANLWLDTKHYFDELWGLFLQSTGDQQAIRDFSCRLNHFLYQKSDSKAQLCLALGSITRQRVLTFANFGYGNHLLIRSAGHIWQQDSEHLFGLKLG